MKRKLISVFVIMSILVSLAACGKEVVKNDTSQSNTSQSSETAAEQDGGKPYEGVTLQVAHNIVDSTADSFQEQFSLFEEKYGCKIEVERLSGNADEAENVLLVRAATGNLPDVWINSIGAKMDAISPEENCYDLSGEEWVKERINADYLSIVSNKETGSVYGIPSAPSNVAGVFYNKKVYEEMNLSIPTTWDEFLKNCQEIKDNSDKDPVMSQYSNAAGCQILFLSQYYYVNKENNDFAQKYTNKEIELHESDAYMRGLTKMYDIWENNYQNDNPLEISWEDAAKAVSDGSAVHIFCRTNIMSTVETTNPDKIEDVGFFPLPDQDGTNRGVATWMPLAWCASKNSKNIDLSLKLLEFLTTNEAVEAFCKKTVPTGAFMLNGFETPENVSTAVKEAQEWVNKSSTSVMEYHCNIKGSNLATILSMVGTGQITPDKAITEIETDNAIDAKQKEIAGW